VIEAGVIVFFDAHLFRGLFAGERQPWKSSSDTDDPEETEDESEVFSMATFLNNFSTSASCFLICTFFISSAFLATADAWSLSTFH